jgi:hypothetical protein
VARRDLRLGARADRAARHEFAARGAVLVSVVGLAAAAGVQLALSDRLGVFFGCCFVLASLTAALTVRADGFFTVGILPPLLLVGVLTVVASLRPSAIDAPGLADDAGLVQRVIAGVVSQAAALVVGHGLAIVVLGVRICTTPD